MSSEAQLKGAAKNLPEGGLIGIAWAGVALAAFFVSARVYARIHETHRLGIDDYWILLAFMFLAINALLQTLQTHSLYYLVYAGSGRAAVGAPLMVQGNVYVRYEFVIIAFFWTVLWCVKASFLALYWRLFEGFSQWRKIWWFVAVFTFLSYVGAWLLSAFNCHPAGNYFKFGSCDSAADHRGSTISIVYSTTVDITSDIMIMLLPLNMLSKLQVNSKQKYALAGVFSVGIIIVIVAIIRAIQINHQERTDPVALAVWGLVESTVSVIVGSLPPLKALLSRRRGTTTYAQGYATKPRSDAFRTGVTSSTPKAAVRLHSSSQDDDKELYSLEDNKITVQREYEVKYGSQEELRSPHAK